MLSCTNCGEQVTNKDKFCRCCGKCFIQSPLNINPGTGGVIYKENKKYLETEIRLFQNVIEDRMEVEPNAIARMLAELQYAIKLIKEKKAGHISPTRYR